MIHIVTLERAPSRVMQKFIDAISEEATYYRKVMSNVWLVDTGLSARQLANVLRKHINKTDSLLVIRVRCLATSMFH